MSSVFAGRPTGPACLCRARPACLACLPSLGDRQAEAVGRHGRQAAAFPHVPACRCAAAGRRPRTGEQLMLQREAWEIQGTHRPVLRAGAGGPRPRHPSVGQPPSAKIVRRFFVLKLPTKCLRDFFKDAVCRPSEMRLTHFVARADSRKMRLTLFSLFRWGGTPWPLGLMRLCSPPSPSRLVVSAPHKSLRAGRGRLATFSWQHVLEKGDKHDSL